VAESKRPAGRWKVLLGCQENLYRLLVNLPDGVLLLDSEGRVLFANPAAEALFGCSPVTVIGNVLGFLMVEGETEIEIPRTDGTLRTAEIRAVRLDLEEEELYLASLRDVSERIQAEDKVLSLGRQLVEVYETIHNRVGKELHDTVGQPLIGLKLALHRFQELQERDPDIGLEEIVNLVDDMINSIRDLSHTLRPAIGDGYGLKESLENHFHRLESNNDLVIRFSGELRESEIPRLIETVAFRIIQEGVANTLRYAEVEEVEVAVSTQDDERLSIRIEDQGKGFRPEEAVHEGAVGLKAMRERVELAGGSLSVDSAPGKGTRITAVLPLK
jgi:two-component system sensor histidine kinase NreB